MARLTAKQRHELRTALAHAERAQRFIDSDRIVIGSVSEIAPVSYRNVETGAGLVSLHKQAGSDLCGLSMAIDALAAFLVRN